MRRQRQLHIETDAPCPTREWLLEQPTPQNLDGSDMVLPKKDREEVFDSIRRSLTVAIGRLGFVQYTFKLNTGRHMKLYQYLLQYSHEYVVEEDPLGDPEGFTRWKITKRKK